MIKGSILVGVAVLGILALGMGCATTVTTAKSYPVLQPISAPSPGYSLKVDNFLVISDLSRSMREDGKFGTEKALLTSFNKGIPKGLKNAGLRTFGKSAYHHTVLVRPLQSYDRAEFGNTIEDLKAGYGNTPLAEALEKALLDLDGAKGNIAVLVVSDGENLSRDPIKPALALKELYGARICIHTVHVGDSATGRDAIKAVAQASKCGISVTAPELQSEKTMKKFISDIFFGHKFVDSDGDGVADWDDKCPNTPKNVKVDKNGCPLDSDGDGVPDYQDKCPNTPKGATVNAVGCWSLKGINFDFDKWDIKPQYYPVLDENIRVLKMNPTIHVEIQGHTDSKGSEHYNRGLSERRAESVKSYFIANGIKPERLTARGFGELKPIATNDTKEGRAKNRRIDLKIITR